MGSTKKSFAGATALQQQVAASVPALFVLAAAQAQALAAAGAKTPRRASRRLAGAAGCCVRARAGMRRRGGEPAQSRVLQSEQT